MGKMKGKRLKNNFQVDKMKTCKYMEAIKSVQELSESSSFSSTT